MIKYLEIIFQIALFLVAVHLLISLLVFYIKIYTRFVERKILYNTLIIGIKFKYDINSNHRYMTFVKISTQCYL